MGVCIGILCNLLFIKRKQGVLQAKRDCISKIMAEFLIFNSDNLSRNFITCGFFLLSNIFLSRDQFFNDDYLDL